MLRSFDGQVKLDTRWQAELTAAEQRTVLQCAGDFARRMGYMSPEGQPPLVSSSLR
jgi:hypothetical protein